MSFDFSRLAPLFFCCGLALMAWVIARRVRANLRTPAPRATNAAVRPAPLAAAELNRQQVTLQEMARDLAAELDSKMVALQLLTRQAEEERMRLEAAIRQAEALRIGSGE